MTEDLVKLVPFISDPYKKKIISKKDQKAKPGKISTKYI